MNQLTRKDLWSLEEYDTLRPKFRKKVMLHKKPRRIKISPDCLLYFEDALTIKYQIQEMLHIEKTFKSEAIEDELAVYNPLLPDGNNWKATFMIEYSDSKHRSKQLEKMLGIEDKVWIKVETNNKVFAIADEDLDRSNDTKTSAVHFLRFQLSDKMKQDLKSGCELSIGIQHEVYSYSTTVDSVSVQSLINDFDHL